jgi:orotidine-5'-phosphate decarboxylase
VGVDPHLSLLPGALRAELPAVGDPSWRAVAAEVVTRFSLAVVAAAAPVAAAVKPQAAFFEALGSPGVAALEATVAAARALGLVVVVDAKRGDLGSTAEAYAQATLDPGGPLAADAVTLSPYLGPESLEPFVRRCPERGLFVLVRTSNPGSGTWQGTDDRGIAGQVARWITTTNARFTGPGEVGPVGAVVGATIDREGAEWRRRLGSAWILVPGFGAQGGTLSNVRALARQDGTGVLVNSSRAVSFPPAGEEDGADWQGAIARRAAAFAADLAPLRP